ncbi:flagellin N-terminal helical domain-containing protein [Cellulosilyticum lentocellum]|uniref:Flagellin n=1 Tax=Cellulosilyticum lentocellum (strain ATCC 49066 / DSM 5427 / NCIMB 11756 / RHM5) TaxID=642492 RepID=F2JT55_CELLD|nr:flagellin [Cellulosilyticum lentocellum]ADZ85274.1 flagellin domain protein [Cellulosilyticum lentocellum DSM 5427]
MIINHNMSAINSQRQMYKTSTAQAKASEKLSSGLRINRAGDDAAGLAISEKMRAQVRGLNQASRNAQDGISLIQTAEGAMDEQHSMLQRMRELAVQASNETYTASDRANAQLEVTQLVQEISAITDKTEFNTNKLLAAASKFSFQVGANKAQTITVSMKAMTATALSVNSASVSTISKAQSALDSIDKAINTVSQQRAVFGAVQNRLEHTIQNVDNSSENLQSAESRIHDTDMAKEMMEFTRTNVLSQATQAMLAQANQKPNQVLSLLQ